ncbi:MAG: hypothetical protein ACI89X_000410 [Planctomycetota bacterium]
MVKIAVQYERGFGLSRLGHFEDHDGFDGVMLGHAQSPWHLEFTHHRGHTVGRPPTQDNLLVFYVADAVAQVRAKQQMLTAGFVSVQAYNPYWDRDGATLEDRDGYRVVLQVGEWTP